MTKTISIKAILATIVFTTLFALYAYPQKTLKKISAEVCECLDEKKGEFQTKPSEEIIEECLNPLMNKYADKLLKEYGIEINNPETEDAAYDFGVEVAKKLIQDCDNFIYLIANQDKSESSLAEELYSTAEAQRNNGELQAAIENYTKAINMVDDNHDYYNARGIAYYSLQDNYKAIADIMKAVEINPGFAMGYYNLAYIKYQMTDFNSAYSDAKKSILIDTSNCNALNLTGLIQNKLEIYDSALISFKKASVCDSNDATYSYNAGFILYQYRRYEEAIHYLLKAYQLGYDSKYTLMNYIGNCYDNLENYDKAIEFHTLCIAENDSNYIGYYNRAIAYFDMEAYSSSFDDFHKAWELEPSDPDIYLNKAKIFEKLGEADSAAVNYSMAIEYDESNADYYDSRAAFYEKTGEYARAIEDSKVSLGLYPDDCKVYLRLGRSYQALKNEEKAKEAFLKSKELGCKEAEEFLNTR